LSIIRFPDARIIQHAQMSRIDRDNGDDARDGHGLRGFAALACDASADGR
jgi:hypothetical protein